MRRTLTALLATAALACTAYADNPIVDRLQASSVTVQTNQGSGSGSLIVRGDRTFVITAAHVIDNLRKTREVVDSDGSRRTVVEFADARIVQEFRENGRRIGETQLDAQVLRYSDANNGHDLALLEVRKQNFATESTTFYLSEETPGIGSELYHVGSMKGQIGANSLTTGVIAQIGRVLDLGATGVVFDQTTVTAFPGSSGGGVYMQDTGEYVGMLVRGADGTFNFIVPIRRIQEWAEANGVEWALDPSLPVPDKLGGPVEDLSRTGPSIPTGDGLLFPTLFYWN